MPATQEGWNLPPAVGVFLHAGTYRLIPQHIPGNGHAQIQYKPMKTRRRGLHQLLRENGVAGLEIGLMEMPATQVNCPKPAAGCRCFPGMRALSD